MFHMPITTIQLAVDAEHIIEVAH